MKADLQGFWCLECGGHFWIQSKLAAQTLRCPFCSSTKLSQHKREIEKREQMSNSDFFQRSDFSCTVEEIHQDLEDSSGTVLVEVRAGRISATVSIFVCEAQLRELLNTIDVVREANAKLSAGEPVFVGRGCVLRPEENSE